MNPPNGDPGFFADQLTPIFKEGTSRAQVDAINAEIGARVLIAPRLGTAYRVKLPASKNLEEAINFYRARPELQALLPAINYGPTVLDPNEKGQTLGENYSRFATHKFPEAWERVSSAGTRPVGSYSIRVAVIDSGVALAHPDLLMNIGINQGEIPAAFLMRKAEIDRDMDGLITFADLNAAKGADYVPPDVNGNKEVDAQDLLADKRWANNINEDENQGNPYTDDLVGWNFADDNNQPFDGDEMNSHGTAMSGTIGAVGNNGKALAGGIWRVSIVPMKVNFGVSNGRPDASVIEAMRYAELMGVDVANLSFASTIASKDARFICDQFNFFGVDLPLKKDLSQAKFDALFEEYVKGFQMSPWQAADGTPKSRVLYVAGAGNSRTNLGDPNFRIIPQQPLKAVLPKGVLIVGALNTAQMPSTATDFSNYSIKSDGSPDDTVVELWGAGEGWRELTRDNGFNSDSLRLSRGTSISTALISGAAALAVYRFPAFQDVQNDLQEPALLHDLLVSSSAKGSSGAAFRQCLSPGMPSVHRVPILNAEALVQ